jgi:tRNA-splicing ligase RtcB (3'-phosphate/5'-hydroxy nucleic acid ligase)
MSASLSTEPLVHEVSLGSRPGMLVPARVYADEVLWREIGEDHALDQLCNVAALPGVEQCVYGMPDMHEGYGFPVGGVAATRVSDGVISPGGVGYDINCGVRLLTSRLSLASVSPRLERLVHELSRSIPSGGSANPRFSLDSTALDRVLREGSRHLLGQGLATADDLAHTEAGGALEEADPAAVSERAKQRGHDQLGTLGSGNHFVEVEVVDQILDPEAAAAYGLVPDRLAVLIHTGSRGLGHQVCTDSVRLMLDLLAGWNIRLPDRQLACAPLAEPEGRHYFAAMCAAGNFAFANRQVITAAVRAAFHTVLGPSAELTVCYDVAHNMAKLERHGVLELCVHRKGATRAFGPSHPETPVAYRGIGQPVFIPGSMGTASWVLAGTDEAMALSFGSACHGAGRALSRTAARAVAPGAQIRRALEAQGIVVRCPSARGLAEEAPHAYKDVERVVAVVHQAGLARKVARLRPIGVIKG